MGPIVENIGLSQKKPQDLNDPNAQKNCQT
jgi:hypothetical protein